MTDTTPNLALPYILPSQAMKHVTHNEALQILDAATNSLIAGAFASPPATPVEGSLYIVASGASGPWSGKEGRIAFFVDGGWIFLQPRAGWRAFFAADGKTRIFDGTAWIDPLAQPVFDQVGVSATPDAVNRLAVSAEASLFNHAGGSHRMKLNKQATGDTASLLFQSNWSGRAEIGLLGTDGLQFKTSADGANWVVGLEVGGSGIVHMPGRPIASAGLSQGALTLANGDLLGFDALNVGQGGFALGAPLAGGRGQALVAPAAGLYALAVRALIGTTGPASLAVAVNAAATPLRWRTEAATGERATRNFSGILPLAAGDALALMAGASMDMVTGADGYELSAHML